MSGLYLLSGVFITVVLVVLTVLFFGPGPKAASRESRPDLDLDKDPHAIDDVTCKPGSQPIPLFKKHDARDVVGDNGVPDEIHDSPTAA